MTDQPRPLYTDQPKRFYIPNSVYLASRFARQAEMRALRVLLHARGVLVTSTWLDAVLDDGDVTPEQLQRAADTNLRDIEAAEFFVGFTEGEFKRDSFSDVAKEIGFYKSAARGGRHVEVGFALAARIRVVLVGPRENFAHYHRSIVMCESVESMLDLVGTALGRVQLR